MEISTELPGTKIIMVADYQMPNGKIMPAGLMLSVRSLELTIHRKNLRLLAIRNKEIIKKLYGGISEEAYVHKWVSSYSGITTYNSLFYDFGHNDLQHFLDNANYRIGTEIYRIITENPSN
ncbi:MAG: hypothetical protein HC831_19015 [Chloroflexia bacterium]|nr:hypothetical protein [Chloroflexia bacterium]